MDGSDVIYKALNWDSGFPTALTIILGLLLAVPLGHLLMFAIYTFRLFLFSKANSESYSPSSTRSQNMKFKKSKGVNQSSNNTATSVYMTGVDNQAFQAS